MTSPETADPRSPASSPFLSRGRCWLLGLMLVGAAVFGGLVWTRGYTGAWKAWGIGPAGTPFLDLQVVTAGAESHALGFDPLYENPRDATQRRMNYPRAWHTLFALGLNQRHTVPLGVGIIGAFLVAVIIFPRRLNTGSALLLTTALFSPAVMLCLERGNIDLVLFSVVALALLALPRSSFLATGLLLGGFALKLYPILGLVGLLRENRRRFLVFAGGAALVVVAYVVWFRSDLRAIREATPSDTWLSYGFVTTARVLTERLAEAPAFVLAGAQAIATGAFLALLIALAWRLGDRARPTDPAPTAAPNLDAFRMGAGIYAGSFLLGSNFDYRLVFLLFIIPQLSDWATAGARDRRWVAIITLAAIQAAFWHQLWKPWLTPAPGAVWWSAAFSTLLEHSAKCAAFAGSAFLLAASAPAWLGEWFAPWHARTAAAGRRLGASAMLSAVLLLIVAGLGWQTTNALNNWGHSLAPLGGSRPQRDAQLAQALFSGDDERATSLRSRDFSLHPYATAVGSMAKITEMPVERAAGFVFIASVALGLGAAWQLARRWAAAPEGRALVFAAAAWCPAFGVATPAWRLEGLVVAGAAWGAVLLLRGIETRGTTRLLAGCGAMVVGAVPLWEVIVRGSAAAALGWFALSLLVGWAAAFLLATRWPRSAIWPIAGLLPLLPALGLWMLPVGTVRHAPIAPPGLVAALRELTPRSTLCLIVGDEALQLLPLGADRRSRVWAVPAGIDPALRLAELDQVYVGALIVQRGAALDPIEFEALTTRLNLDDTPTFEHPTAAVFLSRFLREEAIARLGRTPAFSEVSSPANGEGGAWPATPRVVPPGAATDAFPMIRPRPTHYNLAFGYVRWSVDGATVLRANAESEAYVPAPAAARRIRWEFGILDSAYPSTGGTDGVEFLILGELPGGGRREIFRRVLDPARNQGDRGLQTATVAFTPRPRERLLFQSRTNGNGAFDWSYWRRIDVD